LGEGGPYSYKKTNEFRFLSLPKILFERTGFGIVERQNTGVLLVYSPSDFENVAFVVEE
jgi:hypothetical protein